MGKRNIIILGVFSALIVIGISWLIYSRIDERKDANKVIQESVKTIKESQVVIFYNGNTLEEIETSSFTQLKYLSFDSQKSIVAWDIETSRPTYLDYTILKDYLNHDKIDLCFFGKIDEVLMSQFMTDLELNQYKNFKAISFCIQGNRPLYVKDESTQDGFSLIKPSFKNGIVW